MTTAIARAPMTGKINPQALVTTDERTVLEKAQDDAIALYRLTINSDLGPDDGYQFIDELDTAETREDRQAVVNKWRVYADLQVALNRYDVVYPMTGFRLSKAAHKCIEVGWAVEFNEWNVGIESISWPKS